MVIFAAIWFVGLLALVVYYWRQFSDEKNDFTRQWFLRWLSAGVVAPFTVWFALNVGRMPFMPPLTRHIGRLRNAGQFNQALIPQLAIASLVIISCWTAFTLGWFLAGLMRRARNWEDLIIALVIWSPVMIPIWFIAEAITGVIGGVFAAVIWIWPLTIYSLTVADLSTPQPTYSRAMGKLKLGKYAEAETAIVNELEKCETDFDGWMMLADLYAHQFNDLAEAEKLICELCDEADTTLSQVSIALNKLADWQLRLRGDPVSARRVLEVIGTRMPGTHLARMAQMRINQLPDSAAEFNEQQVKRKVHMPALSENFDAANEQSDNTLSPHEALASANQLVEKLEADPSDSESRVKLARVFAEQLGKLDLAVEQLQLLIAVPEQSEKNVAEWLGLIAAWQMQRHDDGAARQTLERLVNEYPQSVQAFAAQRRLSLMEREAAVRKIAPPKKSPL